MVDEVQTTPVANKIRDMAVSEGTAAVDGLKDASGAGLQASDDEDDPTTAMGAKSMLYRIVLSSITLYLLTQSWNDGLPPQTRLWVTRAEAWRYVIVGLVSELVCF
ncbi:hypothetical protein M407DRAFT_32419 [Tulasnella calospora MUT 4182]|uniref:Uncharacterized protein n=1 Tax=Tulasnella calospora MUT 4182 TaxID=1051891 RepID=A0A0C3PT23_9AGAM|nr:hypothetical protein M407DRAFT_32419 [Tulasnella calospora MUT 4182]